MSFLDCIRETIARYRMLQAGDHLGVAVSGGADSICLLHTLFELRAEFGLGLAVVHIDHNLRGAESQEDAKFVHNYAQQLGLPFHLRMLDLRRRRGNLEQEARDARYHCFRELIQAGVVQKVAVGHTCSDQAETVLYRLLRGAGSAGLAGIRPVTDFGVIRPLLEVTRPQVEAWLKERAIRWRLDSTNAELRFDRNRLRHQLIPLLEAEWNPRLQEILAQTADWAWEEEQYWQSEISQLTRDWVRFEKNAAVIDVVGLRSLPVAAVRRLIREIVLRVKSDLLGISFGHVEAVRELALSPEGDGRRQIAGLEVFRSFNWLRFAKTGQADTGENRNWQLCVTVPGCYSIPPAASCNTYVNKPTTIELKLIGNDGVYNGSLSTLDGDKVSEEVGRVRGPLIIRNWRAGDRYRRQGHDAAKRLKRLFQERRIPSWDRQNWPVVAIGDVIVWARAFGPAAEFAANSNSRTVLRIQEFRETQEKV